jgi:hypothetical protein
MGRNIYECGEIEEYGQRMRMYTLTNETALKVRKAVEECKKNYLPGYGGTKQ